MLVLFIYICMYYGMKRDLRLPLYPLKSGSQSSLGPPVIQGSKVPLF